MKNETPNYQKTDTRCSKMAFLTNNPQEKQKKYRGEFF